MGQYFDTDGRIVEVDDAYAQGRGMRAVSDEESFQQNVGAAQEARDDSRGFLGTVNAAATSALSGATLGLSDVALGALATEGERKVIAGDRDANQAVSTVANLAGGLATSFAAPGSVLAKTPAGAVSQWAATGVAKGGAIRAIGYSGAEAAAQAAGSYLAETAIHDRELTAEGMAAAAGAGFAVGGIAGGAVHGITNGTIAARRLFARTGAAKETALAEQAWKTKSTEVFDAHEEMIEKARKLVDDSKLAQADAIAAKGRADVGLAERRAAMANEPPLPRDGGSLGEPIPSPRRTGDMPTTSDDLIVDGATARGATDAPKPVVDEPAPQPTQKPLERGAFGTVDMRPTLDRPAVPAKPFQPVPLTLEEQLAAMEQRLNKGATLQDLNAQRVAIPPQKAEEIAEAVQALEQAKSKLPDWVTQHRNPRVEHHGVNYEAGTNAAAGFGRSRATFAGDVPVEQSGGQMRIIGPGENPIDALTPNSRIMGADSLPDRELGRALDEEYHEAIDMARTSATAEERAFALSRAAEIDDQIMEGARGQRPELDEVIDRIESLRTMHGRSSLTSAEKRMERLQDGYEKAGEKHMLPKPERQPSIPRAKPAKDAPKPPPKPSFVDETAQAGEAIAEYEKAAAKLADAMGEEAPAAAREAADGLRAAEGEAERRATDRTSRAVDDHVEGVKPRGKGGKPKDPEVARLQNEQRQAGIALKRAKASEAEARRDLLKLEQTRPPKPNAVEVVPSVDAPEAGGLGRLADLGAVLEAADTVGIPGLPSPRDIPVVGPLLSVYLKYRAVKSIAGRMTGRIPATGNARAAALAAKTKDKAFAAVDRMLGLVERSSPSARKVAVTGSSRLAAALSHSFVDDGEKPADDSLPALAVARSRELSQAVSDPRSVIARVRGELHDVADPDLIAAAEAFEQRRIAHLQQHAPKEPPSSPLTKRPWLPTQGQAMKFARRVEVANDPIVALEAVENRSITTEQADTLRAIYPKLFASCQERLVERSAEITQTVPRDQRFRLSLLFDVPLDRLAEPDTLALLQNSFASASATTSPAAPTPQQPPVPSTAGPVDLTALYQTPSDRRAARR